MGSGGGGGGGNSAAMMMPGTPMPGLPIAGQGPGVDAFKYGQFQNFLPDIKAEGMNDMATGLRPDMFKYRSPDGTAVGGGGGNEDGQIQGLRDELAKLQSGGGGGRGSNYIGGSAFDQNDIAMQAAADARFYGTGGGGGGGAPQTMGMGGGGGPMSNGLAPPPGAFQPKAPAGGYFNPGYQAPMNLNSGFATDWREKDAAAAALAAAGK